MLEGAATAPANYIQPKFDGRYKQIWGIRSVDT